MSRVASRTLVVLAVLLVGVPTAVASTIVPLRFDEMVRQAGTAVEGVVVDIQVRSTGADLPAHEPDDPRGAAPPAAPRSAGVEGGKMLFTEVTLSVEHRIFGSTDQEIRFILAGGTDGLDTVTVHGMPSFEVGGRYVVFLRPDFQRTNVPVVGVAQGFFEVVRDPLAGQEMILDHNGNIVIGLEAERAIVRHNPDRAPARTPRLAAPPVPEKGSGVLVLTSAAVERYWLSESGMMSPTDFHAAVRAMREDQP